MKIGFTGTRNGLTAPQELAFVGFIEQFTEFEFHHGCCIGADADVSLVVKDHPGAKMVGHPPLVPTLVSRVALLRCKTAMPKLPYLERNRRIVDACDVLLACPMGMKEELRSGTWSAVRFARQHGKRVVIIFPDGTVVHEEGGKRT